MSKKPLSLKKGDTIGVVSPAGAVKENYQIQLKNAVNFFERKGYKIKIAPHAFDKSNYLAGKDENRLNDLMNFFVDEKIKAIMCTRGGYGTYRLLNKIDYEIIKNNPKIFIGYSDITALHCAFYKYANLQTFHGPLFLSDFGNEENDEYTVNNFFEILEGKIEYPYNYENPVEYTCINEGTVTGELFGGNLTVLTGLLGTPYFPNLKNKILLLEDVAEPCYKIDRMLTQLSLAGILKDIKGILFSQFTRMEDKEILFPTLKNMAENLKIPVGYGFCASHDKTKATLPLNAKYYFNSSDFELKLLK
ncbi:MAG: LD-carboxypeptidase [Candidatus Gastranaerophilales bacterium]|nr:LD-carboxypeptidase [Candidatus Gastranaerophilales bacterium]